MGWYEVLKDAVEAAKKSGNLEAVQSIIDAQQQVLDIQQDNMRLREENAELKKQLESLNEQIENEKDMIVYKGLLFNKNNSQNPGPFCQVCWESQRKLICIVKQGSITGAFNVCPLCKQQYNAIPTNSEINALMNEES